MLIYCNCLYFCLHVLCMHLDLWCKSKVLLEPCNCLHLFAPLVAPCPMQLPASLGAFRTTQIVGCASQRKHLACAYCVSTKGARRNQRGVRSRGLPLWGTSRRMHARAVACTAPTVHVHARTKRSRQIEGAVLACTCYANIVACFACLHSLLRQHVHARADAVVSASEQSRCVVVHALVPSTCAVGACLLCREVLLAPCTAPAVHVHACALPLRLRLAPLVLTQ